MKGEEGTGSQRERGNRSFLSKRARYAEIEKKGYCRRSDGKVGAVRRIVIPKSEAPSPARGRFGAQ